MTERRVAGRRATSTLLRFSARERVNYAVALALTLLVLVGGMALRSTGSLADTARRIEAGHEIRRRLDELHVHVREAEAVQQRYLLAGDAALLASYTAARAVVGEDVRNLRAAAPAEGNFRRRFEVLVPLVQLRFIDLDETVALRRSGGTEAVARLLALDRHRDAREQLGTLLEEMRTVQLEALDGVVMEREAMSQRTGIAIALSSGLAILAVGLATLALHLQITARERAQRVVVGAARRLDTIAAVSQEVLQAGDLTAVLHVIARRAAALSEPAGAVVYLWDAHDNALTPRAWFGLGEWIQRTRYTLGQGVPGTVAQRRRGLALDDYRRSPLADPAVVRLTKVTGALVEPLVQDGRLLGVIALYQDAGPRPITRQLRQLMAFFVAQAVSAIENASLATQMEGRKVEGAERAALLAVSDVGGAVEGVPDALRRICRQLARLTGADTVTAWLRDESAAELRPVAGYHVPRPALETLRKVTVPFKGGEAWAETLLRGDIASTTDIKADERFSALPLQPMPHRAAAMVPMRVDGALAGFFHLAWRQATAALGEERLPALRAIGLQAALVLRTVRVSGALDAAVERLGVVSRIAQLVAFQAEPEPAWDAVIRAAARLTGASLASLWIADDQQQALDLVAFIDEAAGPAPTSRVAFGDGAAGWAARHKEILDVEDTSGDPRLLGDVWVERRRLPALFALPVMASDDARAVIVLHGPRPFRIGAAELQLLQCVGAQAVLAARTAASTGAVVTDPSGADSGARAHADFLAGLAHELRTPLNSVVGFCRVLLRNRAGNLLEKDLAYLERIQDNGRRLLALVDDALQLAQLDKAAPVVTRAGLETMVAESLEQLARRTPDEELRVTASLPPAMAPVETDGARLRQVLVTLIGHARRSTAGEVTVRVEVDEAEGRPSRIEILDDGRESASEWSELGLALCRSLLEPLGLRLEARHDPGSGTAFSIVFGEPPPAADDVDALPAARETPGSAPIAAGFGGQLVLVIEASSKTRTRLKRSFEGLGCRVIVSSSGERGLRLARRHRPQLITLDPELPRMNGWEVLQALRADSQLRWTTVAVVNAGAIEVERVAGAVEARVRPAESRVLVVESDLAMRTVITGQLAGGVAEMQTAAGGHEALDALERWAPDLVVLTMPSHDSIAFLATVRRHPRHAHLPVVIVNREARGEPDGTSLDEGAVTVLGKDADVEQELVAVLQAVVARTPPAP